MPISPQADQFMQSPDNQALAHSPASELPAPEDARVRALEEAQRLASIGSWEFDVVADRVMWSDELYAVMGVSKEDFAPSYEGFIALVHPDDRERVRMAIGAALSDHQPFNYDFRRVQDDDVRILHARGEVSLSPDGHPVAMLGTVQEVTALRRTQERLRRTEERYRSLVERLPAITYIAEAGGNGHWHFVSPQVERMLGYSVDEWEADQDLGLNSIHPDDRERVEAEESRCERSGDSLCVEYRMVARDGRVLWVRDEAVVTDGVAHGSPGPVFERLLTEITERKTLEEQLRHHADHDGLTGLVNRRRFEFELRRQVTHAARYGTRGALVIVDIDHFKGINDSLGHAVGDEVLTATANALRHRLRDTDVLARLGGDEFAVLLVGASEPDALVTANDLLARVRSTVRGVPLTASLGLALFDADADVLPEDVLVAADVALYDAKQAGRDRVSVFGKNGHAGLTSIEVRKAIEAGRITLHAQPIVELATGGVAREELLARLIDESGALVPPTAFLPVAEHFGLIVEIDRWVTARAMALAAEGRRVAVNVSAQSIRDHALTAEIERRLTDGSVEPASVVFEITETSAVASIDDARRFVERLGRLGSGVALDDFGTGFASFAYLKRLPVECLKIDGEFVRGLARSAGDQRIVKAMVSIADGFGMKTVAEGVEDETTLRLLREYGVDYAQGYHISPPRPLDAPPAGDGTVGRTG